MIDFELIKEKLKKYTNDQYVVDELSQIVSIKISEYQKEKFNENQYKKLISLLIKSVYIDYYRQEKSKKSKFQISQINSLYINELSDNDKKESLNLKYLLSEIDKLTEIQKEVIFLRFYFGLKYKEIAKILSCSKNTALSHFHKAKLKLRQSLSKVELYDK